MLVSASPLVAAERPIMTYVLHSSVNTSTSTGQQIASAMAAAVENYNRYGVFAGPAWGSYPISARYDSGVPTANGSGGGVITFGGQRNTRVAQHELGHVLGAGQHSAWGANMVGGVWQGDYAQSVMRAIDGPGAQLRGDSIHFWPYGLNYDSEWNTTSARANVLVTAAWRRDMGIGYTWPPVNGPASGTYRLKPAHASNMALRGVGTADRAPLDIATLGTGTDQQFVIERQPDGTYEIKSAEGGNRNISVPSASTTVGTGLLLINDNNSDAQRWILEPHGAGFRITSQNHLLRVMEAQSAGTTDGTLTLSGEYTGTTSNHQIWILEAVPGSSTQTIAYWNGDVSNLWNAPASGNTNWATGYNRITDTGRIPDLLTNVYFGAGTANRNTTLGEAFNIAGLIFENGTGASIDGTHHLTLGADGIAVGMGNTGAATIATSGNVILAEDQTWTNMSLYPLTVSSVVSGVAKLTTAGSGTTVLSGDNTYTGGTEIGPGILQIGNGGTTGSITGNITNYGTLVFNRSNSFTIGGAISGSGSVTKAGSGMLTLSSANSYSGGTANVGGILAISHGSALGTGAMSFTVNTGGVGKLQVSNNITLANPININGSSSGSSTSGVIESSGNNTLSGAITWNTTGGTNSSIISQSGLLTLGGNFTAAGSVTGSRTLNLGGAGNIVANGAISNGTATVKLSKGGAGTLTLTGANTHTGGTVVNAGRLYANSNGLNGGIIDIAAGATLTFTGHNQTCSSALSGAGAILNDTSNTIILTGNHTGFSGTFTHTAGGNNTQFNSATSCSQNASYQISAGELIFAASGDYTLKMGALASTGGNIRGGNSATGTTTLEVGNLGTSTSIAGNLNNGGTKIVALTKVGTGRLTLSGTNSYSGATSVTNGSLLVNGSATATSISVANGGTLGGSGSVGAVNVQAGGTLAPGTSVGVLNAANTTIGGTFAIEIANATSADQLNASGSVTLSGPLTVSAPPELPAGTVFTIVNKSSAGAVSGNFAGKPQSSLFTESGYAWIIRYTGGDGNDITLTVASPHQQWLWANFGTDWDNPAVTGDLVDPDLDGLANLIEYATGSDPGVANPTATQGATDGGKLKISFTRNTAATDTTLSVTASDTLDGPWTEIAHSVNGAAFTATVPGVTVIETGTQPKMEVQVTDHVLMEDPNHPKRFMRVEARR